MNILIVAKEDFSGAGFALMQAINLHTEHLARAITYRRMGLQYPVNIYKPDAEELLHWIEWADVLNLHDGPPDTLRGLKARPDRPVVTTYHGSWYRARRRRVNAMCRGKGWVQTALIIELATYGPRWVGRAIPDLSHLYDPDTNVFVVSHAATRRKGKGVDEAELALKELDGIEYEFVTKMTNAKCLQRKARAHLTVDAGPAPDMLGHGTTALESWSIGMPVISCPQQWIHDAVLEYVGYSPYYYCRGGEEFREAVCRFRDDTNFYDHWRDVGTRYIQEFHTPMVIAKKFIIACDEVL